MKLLSLLNAAIILLNPLSKNIIIIELFVQFVINVCQTQMFDKKKDSNTKKLTSKFKKIYARYIVKPVINYLCWRVLKLLLKINS